MRRCARKHGNRLQHRHRFSLPALSFICVTCCLHAFRTPFSVSRYRATDEYRIVDTVSASRINNNAVHHTILAALLLRCCRLSSLQATHAADNTAPLRDSLLIAQRGQIPSRESLPRIGKKIFLRLRWRVPEAATTSFLASRFNIASS